MDESFQVGMLRDELYALIPDSELTSSAFLSHSFLRDSAVGNGVVVLLELVGFEVVHAAVLAYLVSVVPSGPNDHRSLPA